ncbi:MAG: leucine dehydrogenase, partial [Ignavibacteria bacterium]|nr:leucine dehydrogenase [Ignavibacteria bacterium]
IYRILGISSKENIPTYEASNKIAEERLRQIGGINKIYAGSSQFSGRFGNLFQR